MTKQEEDGTTRSKSMSENKLFKVTVPLYVSAVIPAPDEKIAKILGMAYLTGKFEQYVFNPQFGKFIEEGIEAEEIQNAADGAGEESPNK